MEYLLLTYFKDKPGLVAAYHRYRPVLINTLLLGALCTAILAGTERVRSLSLGMAIGIVLVNTGESVSKLRSNESKKIHSGKESVNG